MDDVIWHGIFPCLSLNTHTYVATPVPIAFTTPPPSLTLAERTQRAIAEFNAVLDSELDVRYQPMWWGLQALVSLLAEQAAQQQRNAELLEQQRRDQREQSTAQARPW